jgi:hypothetical protein
MLICKTPGCSETFKRKGKTSRRDYCDKCLRRYRTQGMGCSYKSEILGALK